MPDKVIYELGGQQRAILEAVWTRGEATVREVWRQISPGGEIAYTSVLSAMQKLERADWLCHERAGRSHRYSATHGRAEARARALGKLVGEVFHGDTSSVVRYLATAQPALVGRGLSLRDLVHARGLAA